ncbi:MAG: HD domain-containing protein [Candidatus Thorarchaeota archaeon]|jgi:HD superfamily phosphodiesterase
MVFERLLTENELKMLLQMQEFVRQAHAESDSHDYSHVFTVCRNTIEIAKNIDDEVDPFVCIAGALLHDIGKTNRAFAHIHGLLGGTLAEEYLDGLQVNQKLRDTVARVVIRHTPTSYIPPVTPEEKIVFDADALDRLGLMGLLRGFVGKTGSMENILTTYMEKRKLDYDKLHFDFSREMGDDLHQELLEFLFIVEDRLQSRMASIEHLFDKEGLVQTSS